MDHKSQSCQNIKDSYHETDPLLQGLKPAPLYPKCSLSLKWQIWINVCVLSLCYAILAVGYAAIIGAQTSINYKDGLGSISVACVTIGAVPGSMFFNAVHKKIGNKLCIVIGNAAYMVYILSNLYPTWYTMIPSGIIAGFFGSLMLISFKTVIAQIAQQYCETQNQRDNVDKVQTRMFMVNTLMYKVIVAAFMPVTSLILGIGNKRSTETNLQQSFSMGNGSISHCGSEYCNEGFGIIVNSTSGLITEENSTDFAAVLKLVMFSISMPLVALIILIFAKFPKTKDDCHKTKKAFPVSIMAKPRMIMLMPTFMIVMGVDAFWNMDFSAAFVTCPLGIEYIGLVMMWTGVSGALSCFIFGTFNSEKFRKVPLMLSALIQMAILVFLLVWPMKSNVFLILCILTAGWYIGSGIRLTLLPALIAVVFPDDLESSFSVMHMWMFIGMFVMTIWSGLLCTSIKIVITLIIIAISLIGYICLEVSIAIEKRRKLDTTKSFIDHSFELYRPIKKVFCQ